MEKLQINFKLSKQEIFRISFINEASNVLDIRTFLKWTALTALGLLFYVIIGVYGLLNYLLVPVIAFLGILIAFCIRIIVIRLNLNKTSKNDPMFSSEQSRTITTEGIIRPFGSGEVLEKYEDMHRAEETKLFYMFYFFSHEYLLIPKSAFKTDEEIKFIDECFQKVTGGM